MERAQSATEYLVILGIVLLIALIALQLLSDPTTDAIDRKDQEARTYWSTTPITISAWAANSTHLLVDMRNDLPYQITITAIKISQRDGLDTAFSLDPGRSDNVTLQRPISDTQSRYSIDVTITYNHTDDNRQLTLYGEVPLSGQLRDGSLD